MALAPGRDARFQLAALTNCRTDVLERLAERARDDAARGETALIHAVGGRDMWQREGDCSSSKEVWLTFEVPGEGRRPAPPGFLHEFRVIE